MIIGEIVAYGAGWLLLNKSIKRHAARVAAEKSAARDQLVADVAELEAGRGLPPVAVPPKPAAPSEHRYFYAALAGIAGFVGTILAIYGLTWLLGETETTSFLGSLSVVLVLILFVIIIVPLAFVVACLAWGWVMLRIYRAENRYEIADFRHRFLDEREWVRSRLESGVMSVTEGVGILRGEVEPLDLAHSVKKGSAVTAAARFGQEVTA